MKIIFVVISMIIFVTQGYSQFNHLQFKLDFYPSIFVPCCHLEIELKYDSSRRYIRVKSTPRSNDLEYANDKTDTTYNVTNEQINKIGDLLNKLSSEQILQGMDLAKLYIWHEASFCKLEYGSDYNKISFSIVDPAGAIKNRNLEVFNNVCKEILLLGKINSKKIF